MIKVDLITGFLGSGKTTFIKKYAAFLVKSGLKVGVLENDYGAVNVDMMLLGELEQLGVTLEMVAGACDRDCHKRRFKTKLIALAMSGCDRVVIEPSGVFDTDEFFDSLYEEPLDRFYEIGSVITIADPTLEDELSDGSGLMLASQLGCAGKVVLSKTGGLTQEQIEGFTARLNALMSRYGSDRLILPEELMTKPWSDFDDSDLASLMNCGCRDDSGTRRFKDAEAFETLYFMNLNITADRLKALVKKLFEDSACGKIFRVKGFVPAKNAWLELNAAKSSFSLTQADRGQNIIIVIGEGLNKERISACFETAF